MRPRHPPREGKYSCGVQPPRFFRSWWVELFRNCVSLFDVQKWISNLYRLEYLENIAKFEKLLVKTQFGFKPLINERCMLVPSKGSSSKSTRLHFPGSCHVWEKRWTFALVLESRIAICPKEINALLIQWNLLSFDVRKMWELFAVSGVTLGIGKSFLLMEAVNGCWIRAKCCNFKL